MTAQTAKKAQALAPPARGNEANGWTSGLEVRHLRAFVALVDQGSMTAAAQVLGMAQSTISEAIAALERAVGTAVVVRRRGVPGIHLTPPGRALLPHARGVLAALADAHASVVAASREARTAVDIVANESVSSYLLPPALATLRRAWPNTRFAVTVGTCTAVREGLDEGRYDLGLLLETDTGAGGDRPAEAAAAPGDGPAVLADVDLVVFCPVENPLARAASAGVPRLALARHTVFSSDSSGDFHALLRGYFMADGGPGPRLESAGSIDAVKRSVLADPRALGVLPAYTLDEELRARVVRVVSVRPRLPRFRLVARYGRKAPASPAVLELVDALRRA